MTDKTTHHANYYPATDGQQEYWSFTYQTACGKYHLTKHAVSIERLGALIAEVAGQAQADMYVAKLTKDYAQMLGIRDTTGTPK